VKVNGISDESVVVATKVFGPVPGGTIVSGPSNWILKNCCPAANSLKSMIPVALFPDAEVSFNWPTKSSSSVAYSAPDEGEVPRQGGGRDRAGCLSQESAVARDFGVYFLGKRHWWARSNRR